MFRRLNINLPQDPGPPIVAVDHATATANANVTTNVKLASLGFYMNENLQFVKANTTLGQGEEYFDFFHTDNERANEVRREAMHGAIKKSMLAELGKLGIKEVFVRRGSCQVKKPTKSHVTILATEPAVLRTMKDVIVIANEHKQDLGVLAYRSLAREGGLDVGSVLGLAKKLRTAPIPLDNGITADDMQALKEAVKDMNLQNTGKSDEGFGLIVLNPGELLYSHKMKKSMSQAAWLARPKKTALSAPYEIRDCNRVPGHENPEAHIRTVLDKVVRNLVAEDARLYVIGLADGGESVLKYMDETLSIDDYATVPGMIEAIALTEPTHDLTKLSFDSLTTFLATIGAKSYVVSDKPKGRLLKMPMAMARESSESAKLLPQFTSLKLRSASILSSSEKTLSAPTSPPVKIPNIYERQLEQIDLSRSDVSRRSLLHKVATNTSNPFFPERKGVSPEPSVAGGEYTAQEEYHEEQELMMQTSYPDLRAILAKQEKNTDTDDGSGEVSSNVSLAEPTASEEPEFGDYDYSKDPVSCPTFSGGEAGYAEMIFPNVMEDVFGWFEDVRDKADLREA